MSECKCDLRTRLVGDGCAVCNPALALECAKEQIDSLTRERDEALALIERMRGQLIHSVHRDDALAPVRAEGGVMTDQEWVIVLLLFTNVVWIIIALWAIDRKE